MPLGNVLLQVLLALGVLLISKVAEVAWFRSRWVAYLKDHPQAGLDGIAGRILATGSRQEIFKKVFFGVVIAPPIEEVLFRGPVLLLAWWTGPVLALLAAIPISIGFGFAHKSGEDPGSTVNGSFPDFAYWEMAVAGFLFSAAVIVSGSLWAAMLAHGIHNAAGYWDVNVRVNKLKKAQSLRADDSHL